MTVTTTEETTLETAATPAVPAPTDTAATAPDDHLVESDLLVEDVSIDGMCGVY